MIAARAFRPHDKAMKLSSKLGLVSLGIIASAAALTVACGAGDADPDGGADGNGNINIGNGSSNGSGNGAGSGSGNGNSNIDVGDGSGSGAGNGDGVTDNPETCEVAAREKTYIGCDFWPTVTANPVYPVFDFATVVANAGSQPAEVTITRGGQEVAKVTVAPGGLEKIPLPWVDDLKGGNFAADTQGARTVKSTLSAKGAYHMTSTFPVTAWQFNPLQYKTDKMCTYAPSTQNGDGVNCLSVSNDASILIPTPALRGAYRLSGWRSGLDANDTGSGANDAPPFYTITATADNTVIKVALNATSSIANGAGVMAVAPSTDGEFKLNMGDVLQLTAAKDWNIDATQGLGDLSGSLVTANNPIQIISGVSIVSVPDYSKTCCGDHLEETLLPVEAWGNNYIVMGPTDANGANRGHVVRFVGNFEGTQLTYTGTPPTGAPATIGAGEVWQSSGVVTAPFQVTGTHADGEKKSSFSVVSVLPGNGGSAGFAGDPAMTFPVAVPQYRSDYIFLAPDDYANSYADIVAPEAAVLTLDGAPISAAPEVLFPGWVSYRVALGAGTGGGAHSISAADSAHKFGLTVSGYGHATGYIYPGGLNIKIISEVPVVVIR